MFIVPATTARIVIRRNVDGMSDTEEEGSHAYIAYERVRVPLDAMPIRPGEAFKVAQARLGGGRIHHVMRTGGLQSRDRDDARARRAATHPRGKLTGGTSSCRACPADPTLDPEQFRLLILKTDRMIDNEPHGAARTHIAMCKLAMTRVRRGIAQRAVHLHGTLGRRRSPARGLNP